MQPTDHYAEAELIASLLEKEGRPIQGRQMRDAMGHFSGTEIFMHLRVALSELLNDKGLSETTRSRIRVLHTKVNSALQ